MRQAGENIQLNARGYNLSYNDFGPEHAPAVILIHGFPFNKSVWDLQGEMLKGNFRVIAYDVRGHGSSTPGSEKFSIELFTEDLIWLMDELGIQKCILCGLSMGGYIALNAVINHADRFNALVLIDTQCKDDTQDVKEMREKDIRTIKEKGLGEYSDELLKRVFARNSFSTRKEQVRAVRDIIVSNSPEVVCNTLEALSQRKSTCGKLSLIHIPVLILVGKEDVVTPWEEALFMNDHLRDSEVHLIEYAGHLANVENTHEFNMQLKTFIERVCKTQSLSKHCLQEEKENS